MTKGLKQMPNARTLNLIWYQKYLIIMSLGTYFLPSVVNSLSLVVFSTFKPSDSLF